MPVSQVAAVLGKRASPRKSRGSTGLAHASPR